MINTGSKQGITLPPGNPAYNMSEAGVKAVTEMLAHRFRNTENCKLSAPPAGARVHLLGDGARVPAGEARWHMEWATGDLIHNRPALSRWHEEFQAAFDKFMDS